MSNSAHYDASQQFRLSADSTLNIARYVDQTKMLDFAPLKILQVRDVLINLLSHIAPGYLFLTGDTNMRHGTTNFGLFPLIWLPLLIAGLLFLLKHNKAIFGLFLFWIVAGLIPASIPFDVPHTLRSLSAVSAITIIIGIGLYSILISRKKIVQVIGVGFLCLSLAGVANFTFYLVNVYPKLAVEWWQTGYRELASQVLAYKSENESVLVDIGDDRFNLWIATDPSVESTYLQELPKQAFCGFFIRSFI